MKFLVKPKVSEKFASCGKQGGSCGLQVGKFASCGKQCDRCNQCYVR